MPIEFAYDPERSLEAVLYYARRPRATPAFWPIARMLYLADKTSLEQFGRPISGSQYVAAAEGPWPLTVVTQMRRLGDAIQWLDESQFLPLRQPFMDGLSYSDVKCLDMIRLMYAPIPAWVLKRDAQDAAYLGTAYGEVISVEAIIATLDDSARLAEHLGNSQD